MSIKPNNPIDSYIAIFIHDLKPFISEPQTQTQSFALEIKFMEKLFHSDVYKVIPKKKSSFNEFCIFPMTKELLKENLSDLSLTIYLKNADEKDKEEYIAFTSFCLNEIIFSNFFNIAPQWLIFEDCKKNVIKGMVLFSGIFVDLMHIKDLSLFWNDHKQGKANQLDLNKLPGHLSFLFEPVDLKFFKLDYVSDKYSKFKLQFKTIDKILETGFINSKDNFYLKVTYPNYY